MQVIFFSKTFPTGGTGSFGKTMLRQLLSDGVPELRILSRDEEKQDALRNDLRDDRVKYHIGDIRDIQSVDRAMAGVDCVFHAAALKQVPSCEFFPMQAVQTNILGSENVVRSAVRNNVESLVCLSTDKAVFPVNAMGITKAMMEKVAQAAARDLGREADTIISCVRYGNVMYSRGSVIPLFIKQIKSGQPIYKPYFSEGDTKAATFEDYHSHNTERLDVEGVKKLLLRLPEIHAELDALKS